MNRRRFLWGAGGACVALPFLEALRPASAGASDAVLPFAIFVRQGNGVQQATVDGEPERFWPSFAPGPMTRETLAADAGRAVSELADHAADLTFVRGIRFNDPVNACKHSGGGNQVLTAARASADDCNATLALGESLDSRIAALGGPGGEPLTLYAGIKTGYLDEVLSYRGPRQLRAAERSPFAAYQGLFGLSKLPPAELSSLLQRRKSVNDLVRGELQQLLAGRELSKADRDRLDLHFSSIRDLENGMACSMSDAEITNLQTGSSALDDDDTIENIVKLHCDVIALAVACGSKRAATLQIGCGPDQTRYHVDGVKQASFHEISHRGGVAGAVDLHHQIDRKLLQLYKYLLDKLAEHRLPEGTLLNRGVTVYLNDLGNKFHDYENVPYLVAGSAGGFLRTGNYLDVGGVANNKILNTLGAAVGCTNAAGAALDDFGDPTLEKGLLDAMLVHRM
jgi:hypothetical protein